MSIIGCGHFDVDQLTLDDHSVDTWFGVICNVGAWLLKKAAMHGSVYCAFSFPIPSLSAPLQPAANSNLSEGSKEYSHTHTHTLTHTPTHPHTHTHTYTHTLLHVDTASWSARMLWPQNHCTKRLLLFFVPWNLTNLSFGVHYTTSWEFEVSKELFTKQCVL